MGFDFVLVPDTHRCDISIWVDEEAHPSQSDKTLYNHYSCIFIWGKYTLEALWSEKINTHSDSDSGDNPYSTL